MDSAMLISKTQLVLVVLLPLIGSILAGLFGRRIGRAGAHTATILGAAASRALAVHRRWLLVHVYTIGYMAEDDGYQRFFSYISLFTFSMLMLVMSNNFMQLFFGWEAVGLVSYLLIGFWYKKPTAVFANLKAFLVNRVGDFGFLLGIAA